MVLFFLLTVAMGAGGGRCIVFAVGGEQTLKGGFAQAAIQARTSPPSYHALCFPVLLK